MFVHGYSLTLDSWHFQRAAYRGRVRTVYYDQRSHGRSGRSTPGHATIEQLGRDLKTVLDTVVPRRAGRAGRPLDGRDDDHRAGRGAPRAVRRPDRRRRADLDHRRRPRAAPDRWCPLLPANVGGQLAARLVSVLARGHRTVDGLRRIGRSVAHGRHRRAGVRRRRARVVRRVRRPDALVDAVRGGRGVLPELRHARQVRDRQGALGRADHDHLRHRRQADLDRPQPQAARPHRRLDAARVRGRRPHGDHGAARRRQRRARPAARRGGRPWSTADDAAIRPGRPRGRRRPCSTIVRAAFSARPPLDPPADALGETDESIAAALGPRRPGRVVRRRRATSARWCSTPQGSTLWLRRVGRAARGAATTGSPPRWWPRRWRAPRRTTTSRCWPARSCRRPAGSGASTASCRDRRHFAVRRAAARRRHASYDAPDADVDARARRRRSRERLRAGDVVVLSGELGAGKTTFTQGLGAGLGVRGDVTSPTFVIARVHPSLGDGPAAGARRRLPARRRRRARRPRPRHLARRGGHRGRVGRGHRRGPGRRPGRGADRARRRRRARDGDLDPRRVRIAPVGGRWLGAPAPALSSAPEVSPEQSHRVGEQHDVRVLRVVDPKPRGRVGDRESTYLHHGLAVGGVGGSARAPRPQPRRRPTRSCGCGKWGRCGSGLCGLHPLMREDLAQLAEQRCIRLPPGARVRRPRRETRPSSRRPPGRNRHSSTDRQTTTRPCGSTATTWSRVTCSSSWRAEAELEVGVRVRLVVAARNRSGNCASAPHRRSLADPTACQAGPMFVVAHVSDTHFGNDVQDPADRAAAVMDHLLAMDPRPDVLVAQRRRRRPRAARGVRRGPGLARPLAGPARGLPGQPRRRATPSSTGLGDPGAVGRRGRRPPVRDARLAGRRRRRRARRRGPARRGPAGLARRPSSASPTRRRSSACTTRRPRSGSS